METNTKQRYWHWFAHRKNNHCKHIVKYVFSFIFFCVWDLVFCLQYTLFFEARIRTRIRTLYIFTPDWNVNCFGFCYFKHLAVFAYTHTLTEKMGRKMANIGGCCCFSFCLCYIFVSSYVQAIYTHQNTLYGKTWTEKDVFLFLFPFFFFRSCKYKHDGKMHFSNQNIHIGVVCVCVG